MPLSLITAWLWTLSAFVVGRRVKRRATIDVFWGAGFSVVYFEGLLAVNHVTYPRGFMGPTPPVDFATRYVIFAFVALWGLRLSHHLARRQRGAKEDPGYVNIFKGARGRHETLHALRMIYGLHGLLLWFVSMPLQWIAFHEHFDWLVCAGCVWLPWACPSRRSVTNSCVVFSPNPRLVARQ